MTAKDVLETTAASHASIADAKVRMDQAVSSYLETQQTAPRAVQVATTGLHSSVLTLYWKLRPHLYQQSAAWSDLEGYQPVERDKIWTGEHPKVSGTVEIAGLSALSDWFAKRARVTNTSRSPLNSDASTTTTETVALPAGGALAAARILQLEYDRFGLGIEVNIEQQTKIDDSLMSEVEAWRQNNL